MEFLLFLLEIEPVFEEMEAEEGDLVPLNIFNIELLFFALREEADSDGDLARETEDVAPVAPE